MSTLTASGEMPEMNLPETAWLRKYARKGAAIVTRNGVRSRAFLPVTYTDPDTGRQSYPLFPARERGGKRYTDTSAKPQLD
jgi:hypothetical protein